jgi:quercetin dioxygenase-like cupin family protein
MPYLPPSEALNEAFVDLDALGERMGPTPWRAALVGTPGLRVVVLRWPPAYATVPHRHPGADEIFLVLEGRAWFTIGDEPERSVGPGELVLARCGQRHAIRVPDDGAGLVLLAAVAPNEDVPDEAVE